MMKSLGEVIEKPLLFWLFLVIPVILFFNIEMYVSGVIQEILKILVLCIVVYGFIRHWQLQKQRRVTNGN